VSPNLHRERILETLRGGQADRIPCGEFFISDEFVRDFFSLKEIGAVEFTHRRALVEALDLDIATVSFSAGWGALEQPDQDRALELLVQWSGAGDRFVCALIDGPFSNAVQARGFNMLMHYIHGAPHLAHDLFRRGAEEARTIAQAVRDAGGDGVILGEDIAYGRSTYIAPQDLRDLYFPELGNAVRDIHTLGLVVFFHSDGNLSGVIGDLAACGPDGIQGLEPESGMAITTTREQVGPTLNLWGNLSYEFLSAPRTDEEIHRALQAILPAQAPRRFIFGSCAGLVEGMNIETVRQVYRILATVQLE
jgi:uroporphyrinogen decarboxylase